ncbi:MAG: peptidoglycan DD-metalloendopeptidase family protein [Cyclobacteriaceae bacterium]|nr:peptidoglycan DD-metalloendopeptidase family protein [Cyclobacteriaceae bacterium]
MSNKAVVVYSFILAGILILFLSRSYVPVTYNNFAEVTDSTENFTLLAEKLFGVEIDSLEIIQDHVKPNEHLSIILNKYNISTSQQVLVNNLNPSDFDVRKIQSKKPYVVMLTADSLKALKYFVYQPNLIDYVVLDFTEDLKVKRERHKVDTIQKVLTAQINSSLYNAIVKEGESPILVNALSDIYAWVIDFFGLQKGDALKAHFEIYEVNGEFAGIGKIHSAHFMHMGKDFYAVHYDQGEGGEYFDEEGNSLRKAFLKAPLQFSRISSRFSNARKHPVLKITRPHHGVDYAAPVGTPVMTVGDGVVTERKYSGGAGNMVTIRHNSVYTTSYLHLSKYGEGIKIGSHVKQGQVIGYVGSTGLSTGPHLDFRFYMNGRPVDPLKVDPPSAEPVKKELLAEYFAHRDSVLTFLNKHQIPLYNGAL